MLLGRLGVWYAIDKLKPDEIVALLATVEGLGYGTLWYPEALGFESFSVASFMLARSKKLKIGSSIANIYARDAFTSRRGLIGLSRMYDSRFILGLGVSHAPMVAGLRGHDYGKPLPAMRAYLDLMQKDQADSATWQLMLAALGPLMVKLSFERTMGALPYNTTPEHTARARAVMPAGRHLAVEQKFTIETDPACARALGRTELSRYMVLPNYRNHWLRIGFTEADLADGGSDRFIDAMVNWGDAAAVKKQLQAHFDAGATHVCVQPVHAPGDFAARDAMLKAVADT
jgi:probable F420-dependent oxidoreductase